MNLFVLAGQSNMAGRAALPSDIEASDPAIRCFTQCAGSEAWTPAADPLHADKPEKAGVGPGLPFARELRRAEPSLGIGLVSCAWGGSELKRWEEGGDLRYEVLRRVQLALEAEPDALLAGVLWHQGESDCAPEGADGNGGAEAAADAFSARLQACLASLRAALGELAERGVRRVSRAPRSPVPLVLGELGHFLVEHGDADPRFRLAPHINRAILRAAEALPNCVAVSALGLGHKGDLLHFDRTPRDRVLLMISARFTYDGGHFSP
jgi:hypothetical protein